MKTTSLFQLGGIAVLLSASLTGLGRLIYYLSEQPVLPTMMDSWRGIMAGALFVLGFGAVYARQSKAGGILGLVGYILIMLAQMYFVASDAVSLGVVAGLATDEQIAQVPVYAVSSSILQWVWVAGLLVFGISIHRTQVFPKQAGLLLVLLGLIQPLTVSLVWTRVIYILLYVIGWAWLGWDLYSRAGIQKDEKS